MKQSTTAFAIVKIREIESGSKSITIPVDIALDMGLQKGDRMALIRNGRTMQLEKIRTVKELEKELKKLERK